MVPTKKAQGETPTADADQAELQSADQASKEIFDAEAARAQAYRDRQAVHAAPEEGGPGFNGDAPGDDVRQGATLAGQAAAMKKKAKS